jgi:transcriptional regulator with XRE-family HTH domain
MSRPARNAGTPGTPRTSGGLVAGIMLRTIRESTGHTQEQLAETLDVDPNTIKGWETGRRPLINASGRTLFGLRRRLLGLGASADLVGHLNTAMDADLFIAQTLETDTAECRPQLGAWVATRTWSDLLAWVLADRPPSLLSRHLSHVPRSQLLAADRRRFFDAMRASAERASSDNPEAMLLRRQVYYMGAWDPSPEGRDWLASMERAEIRRVRRGDGWTPAWPLLRSTAVARACQGDPTLLNDFIAGHLADDLCEAANLNYWSYWIEETTGTATSDSFMATDLGRWNGSVLLEHLSAGLSEDVPYVSLSVRATCALVQRRPGLLQDPVLALRLGSQVTDLLDSRADVPAQTRRELDNINFAVRMAAGSARRPDV